MDIRQLTAQLSVSPQLNADDIEGMVEQGIKTIICNRPDDEGEDQPSSDSIRQQCEDKGITWHYMPINPKAFTNEDAHQFGELLKTVETPVLAFCRTGTRCTNLWALSEAGTIELDDILATAKSAGYDLSGLSERITALATEKKSAEFVNSSEKSPLEDKKTQNEVNLKGNHDVVIVGGGAGGQSVAASLLKRNPQLNIAIIEPSEEHYYQPGWTMVGGGIFEQEETVRKMVDVMPDQAKWYQTSVVSFSPEQNYVVLTDKVSIGYKYLIVAPGLILNWGAIEGLEEALGSNGVTSNYRYDLAPYTWNLIKNIKSGKAIFTQPAMPIKCAGAPQKAMYLACSQWTTQAQINNMQVDFCTAGPVLFGVADYVPALMQYIEKYKINLNYSTNLIKVDGPNKTATFAVTDADGNKTEIEKTFDILHVCPVQCAPDFIKNSALSDEAGWVDLDPETLQHKKYANIFGIGDANNTANAKTAAAIRKQAPVVAENLLALMNSTALDATYDGYGSCPLTVERGKIVLAEFGYGGKLLPSFPLWLVDGTKPSKMSWLLKEKFLPWIYWNAMLKGKEWLAAPGKKSE